MKFNGRDISAFWSAKAVKFSTNYYTAFDRQEITHRGLLLSYLEVPTVRQIEVDIVVKDRDKYLLDKTLHDMSEFFISSGEAKLFCDRNRKQYFIARCTEISIPEFAGHTAKFTVTFTCSDYRPYDFITNQPIGDASTALTNFTFDGKHCLNDMHCLFVLDNYNLIPKVERNIYEVSGVSGTIIYNSQAPILEERTFDGTLYFLKSDGSTSLMTQEEIAQRQHEVASWLIGAGRKPLTFDFDANMKIDVEFCDQSDISYDKWNNGAVNLKFIAQPYFYEKTTKSKSFNITTVSDGYSPVDFSDIVPSVGAITPVVLNITPSSNITDLTIGYYDENNSIKPFRFYGNGFILNADQTLTINSKSFDAKIGTTDALKYIKSGDFPYVAPKGRKRIGFKTNPLVELSITVSMNARWL